MRYNPEVERLYVSRDLIMGECEFLSSGYMGSLRNLARPNITNRFHVSIASQPQVARIIEKYPNDDPYDLFVDALGELQLDVLQYAHIRKPEVYARKRRAGGLEITRSFVACPLDRIGGERVKSDTQKILGHFGINGSVYQNLKPHVTLMHIDNDIRYANYVNDNIRKSMASSEPISLSFPVADYKLVANTG
jgi:hypothetical protein